MEHIFEKAGLGIAPFSFTGMFEKTYQACEGAPIQPGATCDYCGTGISICCGIKSSDGKEFVVGTTCVHKTGDSGLKNPVKTEVNKAKKIARHAKEKIKIAEGEAIMSDPKFINHFSLLPHPWAKNQGDAYSWGVDYSQQTALDGIKQHWKMCGNSGKMKALKHLKVQMTEISN